MGESGADAAFRAAVRAALRTPEAGPLAARFASPLVTALIADADERSAGRVRLGVGECVSALERVGVPRGRQFVLLVCADGTRPACEVAPWREVLGVPVLIHDPDGATFTVGRAADGTPFELDDELREAEALVTVGPSPSRPGALHGVAFLLCPGAASARTRAAWASAARSGGPAAWSFALAVESAAPVDLALDWDESGSVGVGPGRERFAAMARAAGCA